jgi:hypothetical protein
MCFVLLDALKEIPDHREKFGRKYPLHYILFFAILSLLSNGTTYKDIYTFVSVQFSALMEVFKLRWKAAPVSSTIWKIITKVKTEALEAVFEKINIQQLPKTGQFICVDGKTLRGSLSKVHNEKAVRMFEMFDVNTQLILAHIPLSSDKDHEIQALEMFLKLLAMLGIKYYIVTADAVHCQKKL